MEFGARVVWEVYGIPVTNTMVNSTILSVALVVLAWWVTRGIRAHPVDRAPRGRLAIAEIIVTGISDLVESTLGEGRRKYVPYIGTLLLYIAVCNLSGLIALTPPTADLNTTLSLALMVFLVIQIGGIRSRGFVGYLRRFAEPVPFLLPMNLLSEVAVPFSMAFRLFGNMLGSLMIIALIYQLIPIPVAIPVPFHLYFDVFVGLVQSLIFAMLAMAFARLAMED